MSDKPVYQTLFIATEFPDGWHEVDKQVHDVRLNHPDKYKTRILYPVSVVEALKAENEAQAKRIAGLEDKVIGLEAAAESLSCDVLSFANGDSK